MKQKKLLWDIVKKEDYIYIIKEPVYSLGFVMEYYQKGQKIKQDAFDKLKSLYLANKLYYGGVQR